MTSEWLAESLGAPVRLVGMERIGQDFGLTSELVRCRLEGARSVIVKLWATDGQAGTREVAFYERFAPRLGIRVPRRHFGAIDEATKRGVLVLEDLEGARQGDCLLQADPRDAAAIAATLATMHATWWGSSELALPSALVLRDPEWLELRRTRFFERYSVDPATRLVLENLEAAQARADERLADAPETLVHDDLHLDNVVFEDGDRPVILDWARAARGPAAVDLAQLLFDITPLRHFDETLRIYAEALGNRANVAELRHQLGGALLRKVIRETCGMAMWEPATDREGAILTTGLERNALTIQWWRARDPDLFRFA